MSVTLGNLGTTSLVGTPSSTTVATKGLTAGTGISLGTSSTDVTITNSDPASGVTLTSAGGTETLVNDGTGPSLANKGLTAGTGISLGSTSSAVTITNSDPASGVTLTNAGTTSLVNDGTGPAIATKGLVGGSGIALSTSSTDVTITRTITQYCIVSASSTQTINTATNANLNFNTEVADPASMHDTVTNNDRINILEDGIYDIKCNILFGASNSITDVMYLRLYRYVSSIMSAGVLGQVAVYPKGTTMSSFSLSRLATLATNDYVYLNVSNISGVNLTTIVASGAYPIFSVAKVST